MPLQFPLVGASVELRPFTLADAPAIHEVYSDPEVMRWVGEGPVASLDATGSMLRQYITHQRMHGFGFWAVVEREGGTVIGDAGLSRTLEGEVEMGYTLGRAWWDRGLGTQVAELCVAAAFGPLRLSGIRALVEAPNVKSRRVLEKLGFTQDGTATAFSREHVVYRLQPLPQRS